MGACVLLQGHVARPRTPAAEWADRSGDVAGLCVLCTDNVTLGSDKTQHRADMKPFPPECQPREPHDSAVSQPCLGRTWVYILQWHYGIKQHCISHGSSPDHEGMKHTAQWRQVQLHFTFIFGHNGKHPPTWLPCCLYFCITRLAVCVSQGWTTPLSKLLRKPLKYFESAALSYKSHFIVNGLYSRCELLR